MFKKTKCFETIKVEDKKKLITIVLGTRPEAIKLAAVIGTFKNAKNLIQEL